MVRDHVQVKKARVSRADRASACPSILSVTVDDGRDPSELTMLRHAHPREDIAVVLDLAKLERVVAHVAAPGFDAPPEREKLPRGVRKVGKKYGYVTEWGKTNVKVANSLEEASQLAAQSYA
eukprot:3410888-Pyramimonas_sp.AAC.1